MRFNDIGSYGFIFNANRTTGASGSIHYNNLIQPMLLEAIFVFLIEVSFVTVDEVVAHQIRKYAYKEY